MPGAWTAPALFHGASSCSLHQPRPLGHPCSAMCNPMPQVEAALLSTEAPTSLDTLESTARADLGLPPRPSRRQLQLQGRQPQPQQPLLAASQEASNSASGGAAVAAAGAGPASSQNGPGGPVAFAALDPEQQGALRARMQEIRPRQPALLGRLPPRALAGLAYAFAHAEGKPTQHPFLQAVCDAAVASFTQ